MVRRLSNSRAIALIEVNLKCLSSLFFGFQLSPQRTKQTRGNPNTRKRENVHLKAYVLSDVNGGTNRRVVEWEKAAIRAMQNFHGFKELKGFQHEALEAWAENRDCFVLAATGSGMAKLS